MNTSGHREHAVGVGAHPSHEAEVLDQHPIGQAEHRPGHGAGEDEPGAAGDGTGHRSRPERSRRRGSRPNRERRPTARRPRTQDASK